MEQPLIGARALKKALPQILMGEEFQGLFESCAAKTDRFAVLVIRIDDLDKTLKHLGEDITSGVVVRLAQIIDGLSKTHPMEWGRLDQERFACFCPDRNEAVAVQVAKEISDGLPLSAKRPYQSGWPYTLSGPSKK